MPKHILVYEVSHVMVKPSGIEYLPIIRSTLDIVADHHNLRMFWTANVIMKKEQVMIIYPFHEYHDLLVEKYSDKTTIHCFVFGVDAVNIVTKIKGLCYLPEEAAVMGLRGFIRHMEVLRGKFDPVYINYLHSSNNLSEALDAYECLRSQYSETDQQTMNKLCQTIKPRE